MAQAILLDDVEGVGGKGDVVDVSRGYLRNFLAPRKLALPATAGAITEGKRRMEAAAKAAAEAVARASENAALLTKTVLTIQVAAGDDGRLFGSVTAQDIISAIDQARGIKLDKRKVEIDPPIKTTGTHSVRVELPGGLTADIKTIVTAE